jgi:hypothetical protein
MPPNARIIETKQLPLNAGMPRTLVLWMVDPKAFPRHNEQFVSADDDDDAYTCPDETRGWFYRGPTRVSLVDKAQNAILNTVEIKVALNNGWMDEFDIPYRIKPGYYRVEQPLRAGEGRPLILDFKDYNGDGEALEFALFDKHSCSAVQTQLIGYSRRQDRVIQYPIELKGEWYAGSDPTLLWLDRLALVSPTPDGVWNYSIHFNYGGSADFRIRYDAMAERFRGTVEWQDDK